MPYWSNLLHEGIFLSCCTGRKKGKAINLFSGLLISSGKVLFGPKFSHQMEQSFQERQEAPLAGTNIGPNPKGPRFIHHSSRSLIADCILLDRFLSESVNSRQRKTKRGWAYINKNNTHDFCLQCFSYIFYLLSAFACTRRSIKNEHTMHAYKILVIRHFHIVYSDEQWPLFNYFHSRSPAAHLCWVWLLAAPWRWMRTEPCTRCPRARPLVWMCEPVGSNFRSWAIGTAAAKWICRHC